MKKIGFFLTNMLIAMVLLVVATPALAAAIQSLNGIVAKVNNQIITQSQLDSQVMMMQQILKASNQPLPSTAELKKKVLDQLIDQQLILQEAKKKGISVSPVQLQAAIAHVAKQNNLTVSQLQQKVVQQGVSYNAYQEQVKNQILMNAAERQQFGKTIQVTNAEVEAAMKKLSAQTQAVPEYHLEAMLIPMSINASPQQLQNAQNQANSLMKQLQQGTGFKLVADASLASNNPAQSGDMGWRQLTQLPPAIAGQVAGAVDGSILGPIQSSKGFYIIKVIAIRTLNSTPNGAAVQKQQVQQMLYMQKFQQAVKAWAQKLRSTAYVQIMTS